MACIYGNDMKHLSKLSKKLLRKSLIILLFISDIIALNAYGSLYYSTDVLQIFNFIGYTGLGCTCFNFARIYFEYRPIKYTSTEEERTKITQIVGNTATF